MDLKEKILVALGINEEATIKLGWQGKSDDGTIFVSTAEELEVGVDFSVLTEDGTTILVPVGTYRLESGVSVRIEEEGIVAEVIQSETEETDTVEEEVEASEELAEDDESPAEKADWAESYEHLKDRVNNLENAIHDIKEKLGEGDSEEMAEETEEVSDKPKSIKTTEVKEFSVEEELENLKAENEKLKTELAESTAEAPINTNKFSADKPALTKKQYNKLSRQERFLHNLNK